MIKKKRWEEIRGLVFKQQKIDNKHTHTLIWLVLLFAIYCSIILVGT